MVRTFGPGNIVADEGLLRANGHQPRSSMSGTVRAQSSFLNAVSDDLARFGSAPMTSVRDVDKRKKTRILIASPQPIMRHGLRALLTAEADFDVVGEAEDGAVAVALAQQLRPDVVLLDLLLPRVDGITATRLIRAETADVRVILAGNDNHAPAIEAIRAGASAYLGKDARTDFFLRIIRDVSAGRVALPSCVVSRLVRVVGQPEALSEREAHVLRLVARGKRSKAIARELNIAPSTVKSHVGSIMSKRGLDSRTQMALYALRTGLVGLGTSLHDREQVDTSSVSTA